ncbi:M24 family metallopeptidase [Georgenia deserti]|uniref:M24 family metallopeptidase n=1 Tax=Georgenia deserti TaxID=2093781 RepID=A0ABW4L5S3_9MICO
MAHVREQDGGTVVLRHQGSLSWLLGVRSHVPQTLDAACFDLVVEAPAAEGPGGARLTVVTNAIEAPRLRASELADLDADWTVVPWWETREPELPTGPDVLTDVGYPGARVVTGLGALRRSLTRHQAEQLETVSRDAAAAATDTARELTPRTTEYAAAGLFSRELLARGLDPVVLLVAGDTRIGPHRHPLPTGEALGRRAMLVCCARRHGLIASVTRTVAFTPPTAGEHDAYHRLLEVEGDFLDATRPGRTVGSVVAAGTAGYAVHGFAPEEWHRHHQGGFSGWQPREYPAHPASTDVIPDAAVVAWNPSAAGWKVEDTSIVSDAGPRPLVVDPRWPTRTVRGRRRPEPLILD